MKKTLLAAALAVGFVGVAQAQSSVTLYGIVDIGVGHTRYKAKGTNAKAHKTGLESGNQSGGRWGLRGSEDLGNGIKAVFQLESGFAPETGFPGQGGRLFGREASFALASDAWGTLKAGRHTNFASRYIGTLELPWNDAFKLGSSGSTFTSVATNRLDNFVSYETPSFSGFQFGVGHSLNADGAQALNVSGTLNTNVSQTTVGARYSNGPVALAAAYDRTDSKDATRDEISAWVVAGSYDLSVVKVHAGVGQDKNGTFANRGIPGTTVVSARTRVAGYKTNNYSLGLTVPVAGGNLMGGWHTARLGSGAFKTAAAKNSQNLFTVGYTYDLSKRTNAYAMATHGTGYAFQNVTASQGIVGLRHRF